MTTDHDQMQPLPEPGTELAERSREIIAERGHWPDGALEAVRELEARFPGWYCWWTDRPWRHDGNVPDQPCYGAGLIRGTVAGCSLFGVTPGELAEQIREADAEDRAAHPWRDRS